MNGEFIELSKDDKDEVDVPITFDNMHKYAAMLRFDIERELGHLIKDDQCYAAVRNGEPMIIVDVPGWSES